MSPRLHLYALLLPWVVSAAIGLAFERPEFRPYELMLKGPSHFRPQFRVEMDAYGALAYRYRAPAFRRIVHNVFTTDRAGLRNGQFPAPPAVVVVGDSFVVGVGVSDDQTIPRRLSDQLEMPVYNFGTQGVEAAGHYLVDPRFARFPPRLVVYMPSASSIKPFALPTRSRGRAPAGSQPTPSPSPEPRWRPWPRVLDRIEADIASWRLVVSRDNGLQVRAQRYFHWLHRAIFGFPQRIRVDGDWALTLTLSEQLLDQSPDEREVDQVIETWRSFVAANAERGTKVLIVPLPESGDLYLDAFDVEAQQTVASPPFFDTVIDRAAATGLDVYDVRPALRARRSPYLFLRDDTHYAPHGIEWVARAVAPEIRRRL